ncbi:hypothetical protein HNR46_002503 [Haloferula luteola]|uniref:Uncharacterized protein n=1 Tax=Haloferula luteola TaxID=595692 RepID=A0A840VEH6_9BACT|nr:ankyrin repeat domain-containing protein [Haloferula luteola]MBB5352260.1 hypothetical protein [Haloferula luteola]
MNPKQWLMAGMVGVGTLGLPACKQEPGSGEREQVKAAGYEMSQEAFFRAVESDDLSAMSSMIAGGMDPQVRDSTGRTALHAAAGTGAIKAANELLNRGLEMDAVDEKGRTPLMEAVLQSSPEMVRYLLQQGADPRAKDAEQYKPLMLAVREGRKDLVSLLAPYVREDLDDALLAASIMGQAEVIDELTNYGASVYARLEDGRTPLMLAAQHGRVEAVDMLLSIGANRLTMNTDGFTAAELAREAGYEEVAARLEGAPQEEDFELTDTAELSEELAAAVAPDVAAAQGSRVDGEEISIASGIRGDGPTGEEARDAMVASGSPVGSSEVVELEGAVVRFPTSGSVSGLAAGPGGEGAVRTAASEEPKAKEAPLVMRSYRQRELPMRLESVKDGQAEIQIVGGSRHEVREGDGIPGTRLKVVKIERRMQSGKEHQGQPMEVSLVEVEDGGNGMRRDLIVGLPALSHEPVALVEDAAGGRYYVARRGQRFQTEQGDEFVVDDVRPNQLILENLQTGEMTTVPLVGPRG